VIARSEDKAGHGGPSAYFIRDGIVIIPKNMIVPHGMVI